MWLEFHPSTPQTGRLRPKSYILDHTHRKFRPLVWRKKNYHNFDVINDNNVEILISLIFFVFKAIITYEKDTCLKKYSYPLYLYRQATDVNVMNSSRQNQYSTLQRNANNNSSPVELNMQIKNRNGQFYYRKHYLQRIFFILDSFPLQQLRLH